MKRILLSCALFFGIVSVKAQQALPAGSNFNSGLPANWVVIDGVTVADYCRQSTTDKGLIIPVAGQNGDAILLTSVLAATEQKPRVTVFFDIFSKTSPQECNNLSSFFCNVTAKLYLTTPDFNGTGIPTAAQTLAESPWTTLQPNQINPLVAKLSGPANFRAFIIGTVSGCTNQELITYVVDDVLIGEINEAVLPVNFKSFTAERKGTEVTLNWTTASEQNNKGFFVQRNLNGEWKNVGFVATKAANGNSSSDLSYTFSHPNNSKGISEYRLLQVDFDGKSKYSDVRAVRGDGQASRIVVYPNPSSNGVVNVMFNDLMAKDVQVSDALGRVLSRYNNVINNVEIKGLKSGLYTIQVTDRLKGEKSVLKAVVQ